ncbi:hypothetical protein CY35_09G107100 [Sphagnum magellanicum]|nr:hypothetical protein CY35_09G107100 [Sphagnum magellanicum]
MGGGRRLALSFAVRSLRRRSALNILPSSSYAAIHLMDSNLCCRQLANCDFAPDQRIGPKERLRTAWAFTSVMSFSEAAMTKSLPPNAVLEEGPTTATRAATPLTVSNNNPRVIFVLGGPGSGKGTQCARIVRDYGFEHLSAGDLLRAEINSGSGNGTMIQKMIEDGKIVPSEVTVRLLQKAMEKSKSDKFLIDGFPRSDENRAVFERVTGIVPDFILFFDVPMDEMERRILGRNQGRVDDNIETLKKRLKVFVESSLPVVKYYDAMGKVHKVNATTSVDDVFETIRPLFKRYEQKDSTVELVQGVTHKSDGPATLH